MTKDPALVEIGAPLAASGLPCLPQETNRMFWTVEFRCRVHDIVTFSTVKKCQISSTVFSDGSTVHQSTHAS